MAKNNDEIKVFPNFRTDVTCVVCKNEIAEGEYVVLSRGNKDCTCRSCSGLEHLIFLPSGDKVITLRAKKYSSKFAIVFQYNRKRKRNERQGLLVEEDALDKAIQESEADQDARALQREKNAVRREKQEKEYKKLFADKMRELYPNMPKGREFEITKHACEKYSGRVGRSAEAKVLDEYMINLAVRADIRHTETDYDFFLAKYNDKRFAREMVQSKIDEVMYEWIGKQ